MFDKDGNMCVYIMKIAQWLSGRVLNSRQRGLGLEPRQLNCVVSFGKNIKPTLVLAQPRKTCPDRSLHKRKIVDGT